MFAEADAAGLRAIIRRAFDHATMKQAAKGIASGNPAEIWQPLLSPLSQQLRDVAEAFLKLQAARSQADYDFGHPLRHADVMDLVERADAAARAWRSIRKSPGSKSYSLEARVFLIALLVHKQVSRGQGSEAG
jgi:hypothetical protein